MTPRKKSTATRITLPFVGAVEVPRNVVAIIALLAAFLTMYIAWYREVHQPEVTNLALSAKLNESIKHLGESPLWGPTAIDTPRGKIILQVYRDLCSSRADFALDGTPIGSALSEDIARDPHRHVDYGWLPTVHAAGQQSRCEYVNHGVVVGSRQEGQNGYSVLWHVWLQDGCEFRQWIDSYHGTFGPRLWVVCRH